MTHSSFNSEIRKFTFLLTEFFGSIVILLIFLLLLNTAAFEAIPAYDSLDTLADGIYQKNYDVSSLDDSEENLLIEYGHELFINTPKYIGLGNSQFDMAYAGKSLSCANRHINAGAKSFSNTLGLLI